MKEYKSLKTAKAECGINNDCKCIYNDGCDDNVWYTSTGFDTYSEVGSCAWIKGSLDLFTMKQTWFL